MKVTSASLLKRLYVKLSWSWR